MIKILLHLVLKHELLVTSYEDSIHESSKDQYSQMLETLVALSGWLAAIVSCFSFGSFAVPIKSKECRQNDIDPLVFQSYKTAMCLLTSWIVLPFGQSFYFTPWGIVSGLFWVPAGVAAIFAVKNAGLAVSQGLWSSIIVIVSFTWGIFIFHEQVKSTIGALFAVTLLITGLWGMSFYSSPEFQNYEQVRSVSSLVDIVPSQDDHHNDQNDESNSGISSPSHATNHISLTPRRRNQSRSRENYEVIHSLDMEEHIRLDDSPEKEQKKNIYYNDNDDGISFDDYYDDDEGLSYNSSIALDDNMDKKSDSLNDHSNRMNTSSSHTPRSQLTRSDNDDNFLSNPSLDEIEHELSQNSRRVPVISKRTMGLLAAVFNGVWGGSIMVPMHYAPKEAHGMGYVISFAIGASIITICLWIARFSYHYFIEGNTLYGSYHSLPPFHFNVMWKPGGIAGFLWSLGNLSSMISVQHLGEGVGYSLTQASMLVSGMWGIFYFREVEGFAIRIKWFLSAMVTIAGILLLSFEHVNDEK